MGPELPLIRALPARSAAFLSWAVLLLCNLKGSSCVVAQSGLTPAGKDRQSARSRRAVGTTRSQSHPILFWLELWAGRAFLRGTGEPVQLFDCRALAQHGNTVRVTGNAALRKEAR